MGMTIAIYGRAFDDTFIPHIQRLFDRLAEGGQPVWVYHTFLSYLKKRIKLPESVKSYTKKDNITDRIDFLFSIGGDGTLLETVKIIKDSGVPVLGINTGRLGFLASINRDDIDNAIDMIAAEKFRLDQRSLINLDTADGLFDDLPYALNEITVHKKDSSSMITIHAYLNETYLNSYWADGLIVATPTGSTAYSMSCGGPIMVPGSLNFIITPIAPHNLNVRPVVIPDNGLLRLRVEGRGRQFLASLDARSRSIDAETEMVISKAPFLFNLVQLENANFLDTIRNKLMWGMDRRN